MFQNASHGLNETWIFFYSEEVDNDFNQIVIKDLFDAGFNMYYFRNIEESEEWLNRSKNIKSTNEIIGISSASLAEKVNKYFLEEGSRFMKIIIYTKEPDEFLQFKTENELIFSIEKRASRLPMAINEAFGQIYHERVKNLPKRPMS